MCIAIKPSVWRKLGLAVLIFGFLLPAHLGLQHYVYDDAYIHVRIAEHLIQDGQPYFNPGERVNASSSPVWTILIAAVLLVSKFHLGGLAILNAVISTLGVLAFIELLSTERPLSLLSQVLLGAAYLAITLPSSIGWMETPLALLVMSLALRGYERRRAYVFLLFGLLPFIRLEFSLLSLIALCDVVFRRRIPLQQAVACFLAVAVPFVVYLLCFFGTIVPNTVVAKSVVYSLSYAEVLQTMLQSFIPIIAWSPLYPLLALTPFLIIGLSLFQFAGFLLQPKRQSPSSLSWELVFFGAGVAAVYLLGRRLLFPWYFPIYLIPLLGGLCLNERHIRLRMIKVANLVLGIPILGLWMLALFQIGASGFYPFLYPDFSTNARVRSYLEIGRELYTAYPHARLITSEIGGLGYAFPGYILDGAGLVTPSALEFHPMPVPAQRSSGSLGAIPADLIQKWQPEIIVSMDVFIEGFMKNGNAEGYMLFRRPVYLPEDAGYTGEDLWGCRYINIYIRRDLFADAQLQ